VDTERDCLHQSFQIYLGYQAQERSLKLLLLARVIQFEVKYSYGIAFTQPQATQEDQGKEKEEGKEEKEVV